MYVLFVSRLIKTFFVREATGPGAFDPPEDIPEVSLVDDSIMGWLDTLAEVRRVSEDEGWKNFTIEFEG